MPVPDPDHKLSQMCVYKEEEEEGGEEEGKEE